MATFGKFFTKHRCNNTERKPDPETDTVITHVMVNQPDGAKRLLRYSPSLSICRHLLYNKNDIIHENFARIISFFFRLEIIRLLPSLSMPTDNRPELLWLKWKEVNN